MNRREDINIYPTLFTDEMIQPQKIIYPDIDSVINFKEQLENVRNNHESWQHYSTSGNYLFKMRIYSEENFVIGTDGEFSVIYDQSIYSVFNLLKSKFSDFIDQDKKYTVNSVKMLCFLDMMNMLARSEMDEYTLRLLTPYFKMLIQDDCIIFVNLSKVSSIRIPFNNLYGKITELIIVIRHVINKEFEQDHDYLDILPAVSRALSRYHVDRTNYIDI